jgi:hypothetical protein
MENTKKVGSEQKAATNRQQERGKKMPGSTGDVPPGGNGIDKNLTFRKPCQEYLAK